MLVVAHALAGAQRRRKTENDDGDGRGIRKDDAGRQLDFERSTTRSSGKLEEKQLESVRFSRAIRLEQNTMAANEADAPAATLSEVTAAPKAVVFKSSRNRGNIRKRERADSGDERPVSTSPAPANSAAGDESSSAGPVVEDTPEVVAYVLRPAS